MTQPDPKIALVVIDAIETMSRSQTGHLPAEEGLPRARDLLREVDQQQALDWAVTLAAVLVNTCARSNDSEVTQEVMTLRESLGQAWPD